MFLGIALAPAASADTGTTDIVQAKADAYAKAQQLLADKTAEFNSPSKLTREQALDVLVAKITGDKVAPADSDVFEAMKWLVNTQTATDSANAFLVDFATASANAKYLNSLSDAFAKPDLFKAAVKDGSLAAMTPAAAQVFLTKTVGFSPEGLAREADFLAGLSNGQITAAQIRAAIPDLSLDVWQQSTWDTLAVTATVVYLAASPAAPGWVLPHNVAVNLLYIHPRIVAGVSSCSGGIFCYVAYFHLDVDDLAGVTLMTHGAVDEALAQLPVSLYIDIYVIAYWCGPFNWWLCLAVYVNIYFPETLIAGSPDWVFAYPAQSAAFSTRADADVLQVVFDRITGIPYQNAREWTSDNFQRAPGTPAQVPSVGDLPGPAGPGHPDLGQTATTAPLANYFGLQINGKTAGVIGMIPPTPTPPPTPADATKAWVTDGIHYRARNFGGQTQDATGFTVGFTASQVRAWHFMLTYVRELDTSANTVGAAPVSLAPMSIYYDAPGGYFDGPAGNVVTQDWSIADHLV
ncbi:MAG: hypothetical protein ACYDCK_01665 [Thermoplasmatota archaeon]